MRERRVRSWDAASAGLVAATIVLCVAFSPASRPRAQESPILAAMQDEMKRSMGALQLKGEPAPYYIAYEVQDTSATRIDANMGSIVRDLSGRSRTLRVEVRVGSYQFDSSNFVERRGSMGPGFGGGSTDVPLDDNYDAMRREIWLATDAAYKNAVGVLARKKALHQNLATAQALPDLSQESPVETRVPAPAAPAANREWVSRAQQISAVFATTPGIQTSSVTITDTGGTRYFLNSEGFKAITPIRIASLSIAADNQAEDGAALQDGFSLVERTLDDLPPVSELVARARQVADRVTAERGAPVGEEFTGPVLVEGRASPMFVASTLMPLMLSSKAPDAENPQIVQMAQRLVTPFLSRIGLRVLPDTFSVSDTPSLTQFAGRPVPGAYVVDDEGVPARDVALVEKGRLLTLLAGRAPQKKLLQSNGHFRGGSAQAGVFQLRSAQAVPESELKRKYLELLKTLDRPFGYIVRAIQAGENDAPGLGPEIVEAVKVTPDGTEELVRGLSFGSVSPSVFRDLLEASEEQTLFSDQVSGSSTIVSVIAPSLIFEELEIQRKADTAQKPPIVASPLKN